MAGSASERDRSRRDVCTTPGAGPRAAARSPGDRRAQRSVRHALPRPEHVDSWMPAPAQKQRAQTSSVFIIHVQELDSCAPLSRQPADGSVRRRREMLSPRVASGMVQRHDKVGLGVDRCDVRALLQVATNAAETQVFDLVRSTMLFPDDVVDLMGQDRRVLGNPAILTCPLSAPPNQLSCIARELHDAARSVQNSSA